MAQQLRRLLHRCAFIGAACWLVGPASLDSAATDPAAPPPESPLIASVTKNVASGDAAAADSFWTAVRERHTPIVEQIPNDPKHVLASFVWKGDQQTRDVVLMAQPDGIVLFRDPRSHLLHVPGTDIWYRTHKLPVDAEFSYLFSVNPPESGAGASIASTLR